MYIKDNVLYIMPVNTENVEKKIMSAKSKSRDASISEIVIDEEVPYSYRELSEAKDRVWEKSEDLGIVTAGVIDQKNCIEIGALDWIPEREQAVRDIAGTDNIFFRIEVPVAEAETTF